MSGFEFPRDDDSGTEARIRRDEIHGLMEFGVPVEAIQAHSNEHQLLEPKVRELLEAGDKEGAVRLIVEAYDALFADSSYLDEEIL